MAPSRMFCAALLVFVVTNLVYGQSTVAPRIFPSISADIPAVSRTIPLIVPQTTPLQIALDREVRVRKVGQVLDGRLMQPVYVFDHLVLPVGTEVTGRIAKIESVPPKERTLEFLNADFTPAHAIEVEFDELALKDGRHISLHAVITPGSGEVIHLASAGEHEKKNAVKTAASQQMAIARQEWRNAMKQVQEPGKMHRVVRYGVAALSVHPQYIDAGTLYFAELEQPLDFGSEVLTAKTASTIGTSPAPGSLVHALLVTPLNSRTTQKGAAVEAVLSQPLFDGDRLILPQGSRLNGTVLQARPARHLHHNGQLRIVFHEVVLPDGTTQRVDTDLEGVQGSATENVQLDTEGGAQATSSKTRYLSTGASVGLALIGSGGQKDVGEAGPVAGGATAFKLVGIVVGLIVRSHTLGIVMSAYGGSRSIYTNFLGRGRDITFPKNAAMEIGFGDRIDPAKPITP